VDVSKKDVHVCLSVIDVKQQVKVKPVEFANNEQGFKALLVWMNHHKRNQYWLT